MSRPLRLALSLYGTGGLVYVADRLSKVWAEGSLAGRHPIVLIPKVLQLNYTTNAGGAFGLFGGQPWLFFTATMAVCAVIVWLSFRLTSGATSVGLGLIVGGAVGNLTDRIIHGSGVSGRVTDFIDLHVWPVFNLADSAIVIGAAVLILASLRRERPAAGNA